MERYIEKTGKTTLVPCGQCLSCKIARMQEWKMRMLFESEYWTDSCFITLTYDEEHISSLPASRILQTDIKTGKTDFRRSLDFKDLQLFYKAIRQDLRDTPIKYYSCGEYGSERNRPHFHAIIYGLGVNSSTRELLKENWRKCDSFRFDGINAGLAYAEADSMLYVSSYVRKKLVGKLGKELYLDNGLIPPGSRVSQGIGWQWWLDNREKVLKDGFITFQGKECSIPRYFVKKDEELNDKMLERSREWKFEIMRKHYDSKTLARLSLGGTSNCFDLEFFFRNGEENYYNSASQYNRNIEDKLSMYQRKNSLECEVL